MADPKIGQIAPGALAKDENVMQAFSIVETQLQQLNKNNVSQGTDITTLKRDMANSMANTLQDLSSSSSASDIGTALKNFSDKLKQL